MNELSAVATERLRELLPSLLGNERDGLAAFLIHLAEFDRRRGWEELNYATLWDFCERELKLQKSCVFRRTHAARVIQRFPRAIERLRSGAVTMTTLVVLKDVLTEANSEAVLSRAEWKSKDDVEAIAAELAPKPAPKPMIRRLPVAVGPATTAAAAAAAAATIVPPLFGTDDAQLATPRVELPREQQKARIEATSLDGVGYAFRGVSTKAFADKLRRAQEILSHSVPDGDPIKVLERALDDLIEKHAKKLVEPARVAKATRTNAKETTKKSRHIPASVARAVRRRDADCCAILLADGTRCGSGWKLELDHVVAWALGGASTVENLRLVCSAHNALHARRTFGGVLVDRYRTGETRQLVALEKLDRGAPSPPPPPVGRGGRR